MSPSVAIIAPPAAIVSLAEAKRHLRYLDSDQDDYIGGLIAAAQATIEPPSSHLGAAFGVQTIELRLDRFCDPLALPFPPLREIVSVKYIDRSGFEITLLAPSYRVLGAGAVVPAALSPPEGGAWPEAAWVGEAVRVRYLAGYDTQDPRLQPARQALLLMIGDWWEIRSNAISGMTATEVPMAESVKSLLQRYRVW